MCVRPVKTHQHISTLSTLVFLRRPGRTQSHETISESLKSLISTHLKIDIQMTMIKKKKVYSKKQSNRVSVWKRGGSHRYNITIVALRYSVLWLMVENHGGIMCFLSSNNQSKIETLDERTYKVNWDSINQLIWFLYCTNYKFDL